MFIKRLNSFCYLKNQRDRPHIDKINMQHDLSDQILFERKTIRINDYIIVNQNDCSLMCLIEISFLFEKKN